MSSPGENWWAAAPRPPSYEASAAVPQQTQSLTTRPGNAPENVRAPRAAWLQLSRQVAPANEDVGTRFTEQALAMHRGEQEEKPIRGQVTPAQAQELVEEGVPIVPLALPKVSGETLQ